MATKHILIEAPVSVLALSFDLLLQPAVVVAAHVGSINRCRLDHLRILHIKDLSHCIFWRNCALSRRERHVQLIIAAVGPESNRRVASAKCRRLVHSLDFLVLEHADLSVLPLVGVLQSATTLLVKTCGIKVTHRVEVFAFPLGSGPALSELLRSLLLLRCHTHGASLSLQHLLAVHNKNLFGQAESHFHQIACRVSSA